MASSSLSNLALNYINFPTKVVFRSCKLIPTMVVASVVHHKVFTSVEYFLALCISFGLVLFAAADWELKPNFNPIGLAFVSLSVCADAILPNAQERLFRLGSSRVEVTFFTNIFTLMAMTVTTLLSGDLLGLFAFAQTSRIACIYIGIYTFIAYIAISLHMNVVRRFGGVAAVLVATGRKGMTLILSFVLFPKAFSWFYVAGAVLVLGGLLLSSLMKIYALKQKQSTDELQQLEENGHTDIEHANEEEALLSALEMKDRTESSPKGTEPASPGGVFGRKHVHQS
jgi:adenosine 3'-phospho 5'-phosphosulfate transporter B3